MMRVAVLVPLVCAALAQEAESSFEWAGVFETPESKYMWIVQAAGGKYVDPSMNMVALPANATTEEELTILKAFAEEKFAKAKSNGGFGPCIDVKPGGTVTPSASQCYNLIFYENTLDSIYTVNTSGIPNVAFITAHLPTEFEDTEHYIKLMDGTNLEPSAEMGSRVEQVPEKKAKPWGPAIGAAVIVNLVTLIGVVLLIPVVSTVMTRFPGTFEAAVNAFAAGAILAAAFFLLLYEATHLIEIVAEPKEGQVKRTEAQASAEWGCMILLGFVMAFVLDAIVAIVTGRMGGLGHGHGTGVQSSEVVSIQVQSQEIKPDAEAGDTKAVAVTSNVKEIDDAAEVAPSSMRRTRILCGILLGDFFHNLADGVFIAAAFTGCGAMGWSVTAATVYHEIAQEIGDYVLLTHPKQGNLWAPWALLVNFLSGTGVIIGVLIVLGQELDNYATGMIIAFGGGIYLQIGGAEAMPRVYQAAKTLGQRLVGFTAFFIGAMAIGLVLLDHKHCVPEAEAAGGGHAH